MPLRDDPARDTVYLIMVVKRADCRFFHRDTNGFVKPASELKVEGKACYVFQLLCFNIMVYDRPFTVIRARRQGKACVFDLCCPLFVVNAGHSGFAQSTTH